MAFAQDPYINALRTQERNERAAVGAMTSLVRRGIWRWIRSTNVAETMTFAVTREQLAAGRARICEAGLLLPEDDAGECEKKGFRVRWSYNEAAQRLTLILVSKPWYVPMGTVRSKVRDALAAEGINQV